MSITAGDESFSTEFLCRNEFNHIKT